MTTPGRYATSDGSFARSAGGAAARGGILIAVAILIGVFLLWQGFDGGDSSAVVDDGDDSGDAGADDNGGTSGDDAADDASADDASADDGTTDDAAADDAADDGTTDDGLPDVVVDPPESVKVAVANGRGESGLGTSRAEALTAAGYVAVGVNAATFDNELSRVYYTPGYEDEAKQVADVLGGGASVLDAAPADPLALIAESYRESVTDFHIYVMLGIDAVLG